MDSSDALAPAATPSVLTFKCRGHRQRPIVHESIRLSSEHDFARPGVILAVLPQVIDIAQ